MNIQIIDYTPNYQADFKAINEEWISKYFVMESTDYKSLDHPQEYILDKGGHIFMALLNGEAVGACALIKMSDVRYELAKMGVRPQAQGHGIGWKLGQASLTRAKELGAASVYLESNTVLAPAINLYRKLGFKEIFDEPTPYARCNIQMEIEV